MKKLAVLAAVIGGVAVVPQAEGGISFGVTIGHHYPPPVYVAPAVCAPAPPLCVPRPPVCVAPAPVVVTQPVYIAPPPPRVVFHRHHGYGWKHQHGFHYRHYRHSGY